ncbi:C-type lectin domain family 3 member A-like [Asterias rubens]|uniref:C-type lectin domain family 3 member A-like n=1 Tax=Asterias rubens TaxID=7604 RepID=UPI001455BF52|nr:C-type lectin domain family 3 member A-like [Asterias rubens]
MSGLLSSQKNFLLQIVLFVLPVEMLQAGCPPGWLAWQDSSCYLLLPERVTWDRASETCAELGTHLVVPNSKTEDDFVWREMKLQLGIEVDNKTEHLVELWIGCKDIFNNSGQLLCSGVNGDPAFKNWAGPEPDLESQECVRMSEKYGGKWGDKECDDVKFAACELEVPPRPRRPARIFNQVPHYCLLNRQIKSYPVRESMACGVACWSEPQCRSFNLLKQGGADDHVVCQLNSATRLESDVTDIARFENCFYYEPVSEQGLLKFC